MLTFKNKNISIRSIELGPNLWTKSMTEWSKALDYTTERKWSWFKPREHHQGFYFFKFYLRILRILTMNKCFDDAR